MIRLNVRVDARYSAAKEIRWLRRCNQILGYRHFSLSYIRDYIGKIYGW